jgi:hypothetical protein
MAGGRSKGSAPGVRRGMRDCRVRGTQCWVSRNSDGDGTRTESPQRDLTSKDTHVVTSLSKISGVTTTPLTLTRST